MRRRAQTQGAEQMAEHRLSILRGHAERLEHFFLQLRLVNSHAAAADLHAIQHDVVSFRPSFGELLLFEQWHIFSLRSRKRMVNRVPFVVFRAPLHQRKVCYP